MSADFHEPMGYHIIKPGCCGVSFAMSDAHYKQQQRLKNKGGWWCPHCGASRIFTGETPEKRRAREAEQRLQQESERAVRAEQKVISLGRQYNRMRERVKNGLCPCCNRTFQNLARHMKTKHSDWGNHQRVRQLRTVYGLTQEDLASEIGVSGGTISNYENGRPVGVGVKSMIDGWLDEQVG